PQTPLATSRETRTTQWLPNLRGLRFLSLTEQYWERYVTMRVSPVIFGVPLTNTRKEQTAFTRVNAVYLESWKFN
ncbi:hypothetical protein, partial [Calothrix sp. FACHB-1219]|uniref:hypothetical protein n=1 Tax=Calothrix sp. FACHB-1219 TaxID=2692778 RepID=UPI001A7F06FF